VNLEHIAGLVLVLASVVLLIVLSLPRKTRRGRDLRDIPGFRRLRRSIGLSVEEGSRLHISLGKSSPVNANGAASLAALAALERVARMNSLSDRPPIATSGDGSLAILSQDTLKAAYRLANALELYDPDRGRLGGATPISYIAGALPITSTEHVGTHLLVGSFGPEIALITEAAERRGALSLAATDSLPAQAALYATASEPLIGEELFAVSAYLQAGPAHTASLRVQDVLRYIIGAVLVAGTLMRALGIL